MVARSLVGTEMTWSRSAAIWETSVPPFLAMTSACSLGVRPGTSLTMMDDISGGGVCAAAMAGQKAVALAASTRARIAIDPNTLTLRDAPNMAAAPVEAGR